MAIAFSNFGSASKLSGTIPVTVTINAGDTVVVGIQVQTPTARTITNVVDSSGSNVYTQKTNKTQGNSQVFMWAVTNVGSSATTVTVTVSGSYSTAEVVVTTYTGVGTNGFGITNTNSGVAGTGATQTVALTTQDANNFVVACMAQNASAAITYTASVGNLRVQQAQTNDAAVMNDNTAASASAVVNTVTSNRTAAWAAVALELRSTGGFDFNNVVGVSLQGGPISSGVLKVITVNGS